MKKRFFIILFLALLTITPFLVEATPSRGLVPCGPGVLDEQGNVIYCQLCHVFVLFMRIVDWLLVGYQGSLPIVPLIAVAMIAWAGFIMIASYVSPLEGGGPDALNRAKSIFKAVIWGLILTYGAFIIVSLLMGAIMIEEDPDDPGKKKKWYEINCPTSLIIDIDTEISQFKTNKVFENKT